MEVATRLLTGTGSLRRTRSLLPIRRNASVYREYFSLHVLCVAFLSRKTFQCLGHCIKTAPRCFVLTICLLVFIFHECLPTRNRLSARECAPGDNYLRIHILAALDVKKEAQVSVKT